jgi:hypothetical protein
MKPLITMACWLAASVPVAFAAADAAPVTPLTAYVAVYSVAWGGNTLGEGSISLAPQMDKGCYRYESQTRPIAPVRWFYGAPRETSLFCIRDGELRVQRFEYFNDKRKKDNFTLDFDWNTNQVRMLKGGELSQRALPGLAYDRFAMQQAVRLWAVAQVGKQDVPPADFVMVEDDRIVTYRFAIAGTETVETPAGRFEALRVERVDSPHKTMRSWLAPSRDYLPVKIERIEDGEVKLRMLLK